MRKSWIYVIHFLWLCDEKMMGFCCGFLTCVGVYKFWGSLWWYAIEDRLVGMMFVYIFLWSNGLQILGWVVLACCSQNAIWLDRMLLMIKTMHVFVCNLPYLKLMRCLKMMKSVSGIVPCCGEPYLTKKNPTFLFMTTLLFFFEQVLFCMMKTCAA